MSKPESIKIDPWTDFPRLEYTFITDDFVHEKLAVIKVNSKAPYSSANIKLSLSDDKNGKNVSDEIKLWFTLPQGRSLFSKIKSSNYLKLQFDNGVTENWGKKWNFYAGLNSTKTLENISLRLGAAHLDPTCHSDNRLKLDINADNKNITWYNRTVVTQDNFTFAFLGAYDLTNKILLKNNILLGYQFDYWSSAYIRLLNNGFRKTGFNWSDAAGLFDHLKIDLITSGKGWKVGAETTFNTRGNLFNEFVFVFEYLFPKNLNVKGNISSKASASLTFRYPSLLFSNIAKTSFGFHGSNLINEKRAFKYGVQVEFNV